MSSDYDRRVFINCPFDDDYKPLFRVLLFSVRQCGFLPRTALDNEDSSEVRIMKIYRTIGDCRLGIHDLSRADPGPEPRFNMPLELGIFLGAKYLGQGEQGRKACLVLDRERYRYQRYVSDVSGQDIAWHDNDPRTLLIRVRDWLATQTEAHIPGGEALWVRYQTFNAELTNECIQHKQRTDDLAYIDYVRHLDAFVAGYTEMLVPGQGSPTKNPLPWQVQKKLSAIDPGEENPYIILTKGANGYTFLQSYRRLDGSWIVDFQDGHLDAAFQSVEPVPHAVVEQMFDMYLKAEEGWRSLATWISRKS